MFWRFSAKSINVLEYLRKIVLNCARFRQKIKKNEIFEKFRNKFSVKVRNSTNLGSFLEKILDYIYIL